MTLDQLLADIASASEGYATRNMPDKFFPRIVSPGKFEGEPTWVVHFWNMALEGFADRDECDGETHISCFEVDDLMAQAGIGARGSYIALWETDNGFVCWEQVTSAELDALEGCTDV